MDAEDDWEVPDKSEPTKLKLNPDLKCGDCVKFSPPFCYEHLEVYPHSNPKATACRQFERKHEQQPISRPSRRVREMQEQPIQPVPDGSEAPQEDSNPPQPEQAVHHQRKRGDASPRKARRVNLSV